MRNEKIWYFLALFGHGNLFLTIGIAFLVRLMYNLGLVSDAINSVGTGLAFYGLTCYAVSIVAGVILDKYEERDKRKEVK